MNLTWLKTGLDALVGLMNIFPGWKTKVGAVLQVVATALMAASYFGLTVPTEWVLAIQTAASTLTAVGAANQPANAQPSA